MEHHHSNDLLFHSTMLGSFRPIREEGNLQKEFDTLTVLHHDGEEADYDFGAGSDEDLPLPPFLGIVDAFQGIGEHVHPHHGACKQTARGSVNLNTHTEKSPFTQL